METLIGFDAYISLAKLLEKPIVILTSIESGCTNTTIVKDFINESLKDSKNRLPEQVIEFLEAEGNNAVITFDTHSEAFQFFTATKEKDLYGFGLAVWFIDELGQLVDGNMIQG